MPVRDLSLNSRVEGSRPLSAVTGPVHFELSEIKEHFDESMESIKNQYIVADSLAAEGKMEDCKNIWRSQIIFMESILDFYLHEISKYGLYQMFRGQWPKSERYKTFQVPMSKVEEAIESIESKEWFFDYLNTRFSRDVFLSDESMKDQLNLIGIGFGKAMEKAFPRPTINESQRFGSDVIKKLFKRRNVIAHQLDREHDSAEQNDITKAYVEEYANNIIAIVEGIHKTAIENG